jgi:predicted transposase YbfD/YdcC
MDGQGASIMDHFQDLEDPRIERSKRHQLLDIVAIAICAVICGADTWVYVEMFGRSKEEWFRTFLDLPHGIPSHDTFGDVFSRLDPEQFQRCFMEWTQAVAALMPGEVVAIDGKTVRRSRDRSRGKGAIHLVSAWASANTLTLGQVKTEEKSNEITAIPQLLQLLELKGCIVTIDAMGCQKEIAQGILDRGADYVLAVKENQGRLYDDVRDLFAGAEEFGYAGVPHDYATTLNKGHGRIERRECWAISDPLSLEYLSTGQSWPELRSVIKVVGHRDTDQGAAVQARYYISSLDSSAERLLAAIRAHWSIENSLHCLDVTFGEDQSRIRNENAPQNMATLRQISHNLLKRETSLKVGIQGKRLQAGWKEDYLLKVLRS